MLKSWGVKKNGTTHIWEFADERIRKRKLQGKDSEMVLHEKHYSSKRLRKELARHVTHTSTYFRTRSYDPPTPDGVVIRTPRLASQLLFPTHNIRIDNLPWGLFKREIQTLEISHRSVSAVQGNVPDSLVVPTCGQPYSPFSSVTRPGSSGMFNTTVTENWLYDPINLFDPILHGWALENDLIYSSWSDAAISFASPGISSSPSLSAAPVSHDFALSVISESLLGQKLGDISEVTAFLKRYTVNENDLDLSTFTGAHWGQTDLSSFAPSVQKIFDWTISLKNSWLLSEILALQSTTADVLATKLFPVAIRAGNIELVAKLLSRGVCVNSPVERWGFARWLTPLSLAVECRNTEMVELLCASGASPEVQGTSVIAYTRDHDYLWSHSNINILSLLLKFGADPETFVSDEPRGFPLINAASKGEAEAVGLLLNAKARIHWGTQGSGTALQAAAAGGHEAVVRILIEAGADVNAILDCYDSNCLRSSCKYVALTTPVQLAASGDHTDIVQILLQSGALANYCPSVARFGLRAIDIEFRIWSERRRPLTEETPFAYAIQYAALNQNITLIQQLLAAGANVDSRIGTNLGDTPLQTAARLGNVEMTRLLLTHNANVNAPPGKYYGRTAIQAAAENGNQEIVQILLDANANINANAGWKKGRTAIQAAMEKCHSATAATLLRLGADINGAPGFREGMTALQAAAAGGDPEILKLALHFGADVNAPAGPENGVTALQAVINHENISALNILLQAGADVYGGLSKTPLQYAAQLGWLDGVKCLLDYGSDINALPPYPHWDAHSALGYAVGNRDDNMIGLLLSNGADPNAPAINDEGAPSAFIFALAEGCSLDTIKLFLQNHADITQSWGTQSALDVAVDYEADVVKTIMDLMSQLPGDQYANAMKTVLANITVDIDWPPDFGVVKMLIQAGADTNATNIDTGETLLQRCVIAPNIDVVKLLLENGAEVNTPATQNTGTPLQIAILKEQVEIADLLIKHGADINAPPAGKKGATALQAAAIHGYSGLALRLLENGADVAAAPSPISGRTAIDGAAEHGHLEMLQLLLNAYGDREDLPLVCSKAASIAEREFHWGIANWLKTYTRS
ncbi:hypothetical protein CNMCM8980_003184 [Aspergillus fumigatiaffinis]|nr:hypothetical protein CNMCM8980_003184 [Aspergillus fumigatiaffinis]